MNSSAHQELIVVCDVEDLADGQVRRAQARGVRLGVVLAHGDIKVFFGGCPHHGGPLELGRVRSTITASAPGEPVVVSDAPVLVCPWHNYEFDLATGCGVAAKTMHLRFIPHETHGTKVCVQWPPSR